MLSKKNLEETAWAAEVFFASTYGALLFSLLTFAIMNGDDNSLKSMIEALVPDNEKINQALKISTAVCVAGSMTSNLIGEKGVLEGFHHSIKTIKERNNANDRKSKLLYLVVMTAVSAGWWFAFYSFGDEMYELLFKEKDTKKAGILGLLNFFYMLVLTVTVITPWLLPTRDEDEGVKNQGVRSICCFKSSRTRFGGILALSLTGALTSAWQAESFNQTATIISRVMRGILALIAPVLLEYKSLYAAFFYESKTEVKRLLYYACCLITACAMLAQGVAAGLLLWSLIIGSNPTKGGELGVGILCFIEFASAFIGKFFLVRGFLLHSMKELMVTYSKGLVFSFLIVTQLVAVVLSAWLFVDPKNVTNTTSNKTAGQLFVNELFDMNMLWATLISFLPVLIMVVGEHVDSRKRALPGEAATEVSPLLMEGAVAETSSDESLNHGGVAPCSNTIN